MKWQIEYSVGVESMDDQHQQLFGYFDRLIEEILERKGETSMAEILGFLDRYIARHFADEEQLMARYKYPDARLHKAQHELFIQEFEKLKRRIASGGTREITENQLAKILTQWWVNHIQALDRKLGEFIVSVQSREKARQAAR